MPPMDINSTSINMVLFIVLLGVAYFVLKAKKEPKEK